MFCLIINAFLNRESLYDYTCVRLNALYVKHYSNAQPNLITRHVSHSIPSSSPASTHALPQCRNCDPSSPPSHSLSTSHPPPPTTTTNTHTLLPCTGVVCRTSFFSILMHGLQVTMCVCETAMAAVSIAVHWCRVNLSWLLLVHGVSPLYCVDLGLRAQTAVYNVRVRNGYFWTQGYQCTCFL